MIKPAAALVALALLTAPAVAQPMDDAGVLAAVGRMVQPDNAHRLAAVKALLDERHIAYTVQDFPGSPESKGVAGHNVVVTIGSGPREIVLGAHYDAVVLPDGTTVGGVVDNGASVVALANAIQALEGYAPKHRIVVIFFDQEELGLLGSKAWLAQADRSRIDASVIFDVDAYGDSVIYGGMTSDTHGVVRQAMLSVCVRKPFDCIRFDRFPPSDDQSFAAANIPTVSIGMQPAADAHQLWLLMHKDPKESGLAEGFVPRAFHILHSPADDMTAVEPAAVTRAFEMAFEVVRELDDAYPLGVSR